MKYDIEVKKKLNIGAVSLNTIKAVLELSSEITTVNYSLISSRRQIEAASLGSGYVNNFSTEDFAKFVRDCQGQTSTLKLGRDHGGPYQRSDESKLTLHDSLVVSKKSFEVDIASGYSHIHIDPEKAISHNNINNLEEFISISKQLVGYCLEIKKRYAIKELDFEIGTDEGFAKHLTLNDWDLFVSSLVLFFDTKNEPPPLILTMPLGTKVINNSNLANYYSDTELEKLQEKVDAALNLSTKYGLQLKLHNSDFLSREMLDFYLSHGISNFNIAPELGVHESNLIVNILKAQDLEHLAQKFIELSYSTNNWKRWINDQEKFSKNDCGIAAGHYIYSTLGFKQLKQEIIETGKVGDLDSMLVSEIKKLIKNYFSINE